MPKKKKKRHKRRQRISISSEGIQTWHASNGNNLYSLSPDGSETWYNPHNKNILCRKAEGKTYWYKKGKIACIKAASGLTAWFTKSGQLHTLQYSSGAIEWYSQDKLTAVQLQEGLPVFPRQECSLNEVRNLLAKIPMNEVKVKSHFFKRGKERSIPRWFALKSLVKTDDFIFATKSSGKRKNEVVYRIWIRLSRTCSLVLVVSKDKERFFLISCWYSNIPDSL